MKQSRFTDEQIIGFLKLTDAGMSAKELCRSGGFSQHTFYKRRSRFGGMEPLDAAKLRELEAENNPAVWIGFLPHSSPSSIGFNSLPVIPTTINF